MKSITIRSSLLVAIVASVAVFTLEVTRIKGKLLSLNNRLTVQTAALGKAETDLASTRQEASKAAIALTQTADALAAKTAQVSAQAEQIAKLTSDSKKLQQERDDAQAQLAAYRPLMSPEQVANAAKLIKNLQDSLVALQEENTLLGRRIKKLEPASGGISFRLPADLSAKVLVFDPKWRFVVLDAGEDKGVVEHGELLVSRGGRLVAKVQVSRVEKNRCVANVMDGWNLGELMEGDQAIPADPKS
jgi:hypothetical protein